MTKLVQDIKAGQNNAQLLASISTVSQENGRLKQELDNCQRSANTNQELKALRDQNQQLQTLVQQLGVQLYEQAKQYKQEQEYENEISNLKAQIESLKVNLQNQKDINVNIQRENQNNTVVLTQRAESFKVDLDVCKSSQSTM